MVGVGLGAVEVAKFVLPVLALLPPVAWGLGSATRGVAVGVEASLLEEELLPPTKPGKPAPAGLFAWTSRLNFSIR